MANFNHNPYSDTMNRFTREYNNLLRQAMEYRRAYGVPSVDEGNCYKAAAAVCKQIADYQSTRETREKWLLLQKDAEDKMIEIVTYLNPQMLNQAAAAQPSLSTAIPGTMPQAPAAKPAAKPAAPAPAQTQNPMPDKTTTVASTDPNDPRPITTTPTGFVTRNALPPNIKAETIEGWYQQMPDHDFSDIHGMDELKASMLKTLTRINMQQTCEEMGLNPFTCFLLYGPQGTGKTHIITAFAAELMKRGFKFIQLASGDIHQSLVGESEKIISIAFQEAIDNAPCAIYIDEFEGVSVPRDSNAQGYEKRLTIALIEEYNKLKSSHKPIILLAATNRPNMIDPAWIDRMNNTILLPLPSEENRRSFFEAKLSKYRLTDGLDLDFIIDNTDNYNYRDMDTVISSMQEELLMRLIDKYEVRDENGEIDHAKTDQAAREAVQRGECEVSREFFESILKAHKPSPKSDFMRDLEEFEQKRAQAQSS